MSFRIIARRLSRNALNQRVEEVLADISTSTRPSADELFSRACSDFPDAEVILELNGAVLVSAGPSGHTILRK